MEPVVDWLMAMRGPAKAQTAMTTRVNNSRPSFSLVCRLRESDCFAVNIMIASCEVWLCPTLTPGISGHVERQFGLATGRECPGSTYCGSAKPCSIGQLGIGDSICLGACGLVRHRQRQLQRRLVCERVLVHN